MKSSYLSLNPFIPCMKKKHPVEWPSKFGRSAELEVEIGFGLGDFLIQQAQTPPEKDYLGIELGWVYVRRTLRKINLAGVKNVRVIQADIRVALERAFLEKGMVRSVVGEDSLVQDFWIEIVRKKKMWHIRPAKGCSIIPTAGIQKKCQFNLHTASQVLLDTGKVLLQDSVIPICNLDEFDSHSRRSARLALLFCSGPSHLAFDL